MHRPIGAIYIFACLYNEREPSLFNMMGKSTQPTKSVVRPRTRATTRWQVLDVIARIHFNRPGKVVMHVTCYCSAHVCTQRQHALLNTFARNSGCFFSSSRRSWWPAWSNEDWRHSISKCKQFPPFSGRHLSSSSTWSSQLSLLEITCHLWSVNKLCARRWGEIDWKLSHLLNKACDRLNTSFIDCAVTPW